ncbi:MAG: imidazole glycerol phosphate synthase subunit HisH [Bacteroidales bacterium]|nr:imidazole glycerol phosphate synthase subunit HisH [Bacteroidales bacterium]
MIAVVDYDMGNLRSLENALDRLGATYEVTADPELIRRARKVILPGVGNAGMAMDNLVERELPDVIRSLRQPVLGICVGMQILCRDSEEAAGKPCLGVFDAHVRRFTPAPGCKVPHMGWNSLGNLDGKLFKELGQNPYVYFVHSYYAGLCPDTVATCRYGDVLFSAALRYENFYGTQFHPEKSGGTGEAILRNFLNI